MQRTRKLGMGRDLEKVIEGRRESKTTSKKSHERRVDS
jgi:hypothetical protein